MTQVVVDWQLESSMAVNGKSVKVMNSKSEFKIYSFTKID